MLTLAGAIAAAAFAAATPSDTLERDGRLVANWFLVDVSPYMVAGEVFLPDGQVQRMTEVAIP